MWKSAVVPRPTTTIRKSFSDGDLRLVLRLEMSGAAKQLQSNFWSVVFNTEDLLLF